MDKRIDYQFKRIVDSIGRLTAGTPLEGTSVHLCPAEGENRIAFSTAAPDGSAPFQGYRGILVYALEGWSDESLDQRLYESAEAAVQDSLNPPALPEQEAQPVDSAFVVDVGRDLPDCPQCLSFKREIDFQLLRLNMMAKEAASVSRHASQPNLQRFVEVLRSFLNLQQELSGTRSAYRDHRFAHLPLM